jgi:hypothetical protein
MKDNHTRLATFMLLLLALLLIANGVISAQDAAPAAIGANELRVTGFYQGSVTIDEPASLGALDLVFNVTDEGGVLLGKVNAAKTQVFLGGPSFTGSVTASQGITPTFRVDSEVFNGVVSGRPVQRRFTLIGEVLDDNNTLRGDYTERIIGFTPQPLLVTGKFLVTRPNGSEVIIPDSDPATATPTPTATQPGGGGPPTLTPTATSTRTATPPGNPGSPNAAVYLPVIMQNAGAASSTVVEPALAEGMQTVAATATPVPPQAPSGGGQTSYLPVVVK